MMRRAFLAFCALQTAHGDGFSHEVSKRMMRYAYASYYPHPEEHGLPPGAQVKGTFKFSLGIWDTAFAFLAVDRELSEVVLSFRGSETLTQLFEEIVHHALVPWPGAPEAQVNEFFLQAVNDLLPQITKAIKKIQEDECTDCQLMVTGHSLGASMALFSAFNISFWSPKAPILYTFGQPRSANSAFARLVEKQLPRIYRLINAADPVPHIPRCARASSGSCEPDSKAGYYHSGLEYWFPHEGYKNGKMCSYHECMGPPHSEDDHCSNSLNFPRAAALSDHHGYWDVLKGGYCGNETLPATETLMV